MTVVESSVCGRPESGTKQSVLLEFKSTKLKTNETFTCRTNILEPRKPFLLIGEWDRLGSGTWENDQRHIPRERILGSCAYFRPHDDLKVKVIIKMPQTTIDDQIPWSMVNDHWSTIANNNKAMKSTTYTKRCTKHGLSLKYRISNYCQTQPCSFH